MTRLAFVLLEGYFVSLHCMDSSIAGLKIEVK